MIELEVIMTDRPARKTAGWRVPVLIGCGGLLVMAVLAAIVGAAFWPRISSFYRSATGTLGELRVVQSALQAKYDTAQVGVTVKRQLGVTGRILCIQLVNPPFLARTRGADLPAKAREVATAARDALPVASIYEHYQVILTKQEGVVVRTGTRGFYNFELGHLPPRVRTPSRHGWSKSRPPHSDTAQEAPRRWDHALRTNEPRSEFLGGGAHIEGLR